MSEMPPPSAPQPPAFDPNMNPKAAAKAAKAYAKASRPWFKKKRWWAVGAVLLIIIIAAASGGGGSSDKGPTVVSDSSGASPSSTASSVGSKPTKAASQPDPAKVGTKDNPAKIGQTLSLAGTQYTVKDVKTTQQIGGSYGAKASGTFVVVTLTLENMKNETHSFNSDAAKFIGNNGASYDTDDQSAIYADNPLVFEDMQPQLPKTGVLVYDVPPAATKGSMLKVSDLFGDGDAYISLGL